MRKKPSRRYGELVTIPSFKERFEYLSLHDGVGDPTFGSSRYLNQRFYRSSEWHRARRDAIARDLGCDLGLEGYEIFGKILVHHINPLTEEDISESSDALFDLDNLITVSHSTHNAIHFGDISLLNQPYTERRPGDTKLW